MGQLTIPAGGSVYVDAQAIIYTVEKHPLYFPLLRPLWAAVQSRTVEVTTSELSLLEVLVGPLKTGNAILQATYEHLFQHPDFRPVDVSRSVLRNAAQLRATSKLRSPDAIHVATAVDANCVALVTNDLAFRSVTAIPVVILDDVLVAP